jgi:ribosomal protein S27E
MNYADSLGPPEPKKKKYNEDTKCYECENCEELFLSLPEEVVCPYCGTEQLGESV